MFQTTQTFQNPLREFAATAQLVRSSPIGHSVPPGEYRRRVEFATEDTQWQPTKRTINLF
jgi:hypothetical protein